MSWETICVCDGKDCDEKRQETSKHTWLVIRKDDWLAVRRWDDVAAKEPDVKHLCGEGCLYKIQAEHLAIPEVAKVEEKP